MGRLLGLTSFMTTESDAELVAIEKSIRTATRNDRKALKDAADDQKSLVNRVLRGQDPSKANVSSEVRQKVVENIERIRSRFQNIVIRRTGESKDNVGRSIIGLPPYRDIALPLDLYKAEMEYLQKVARDLVQQKDAGLQFGMGKASEFYYAFSLSLTRTIIDVLSQVEESPDSPVLQ